MGAIREEVKLIGTLKTKKIIALFDTGAYRNYIKRELSDGEMVDSIGFHIYEGIHRAILADGSISVGEKVRFKELHIKDLRAKEPEFVVMEDLIEDVIIGVHLMQELVISLDPPNGKIEMKAINR